MTNNKNKDISDDSDKPKWWNDPRLSIGLTDFAEVAGEKAEKIRKEYSVSFDKDPVKNPHDPSFKTTAIVMSLIILKALATLAILIVVLFISIVGRIIVWIAEEMGNGPSSKARGKK